MSKIRVNELEWSAIEVPQRSWTMVFLEGEQYVVETDKKQSAAAIVGLYMARHPMTGNPKNYYVVSEADNQNWLPWEYVDVEEGARYLIRRRGSIA